MIAGGPSIAASGGASIAASCAVGVLVLVQVQPVAATATHQARRTQASTVMRPPRYLSSPASTSAYSARITPPTS